MVNPQSKALGIVFQGEKVWVRESIQRKKKD